MLAKTYSAILQGVEGRLVQVEVDVSRGLPVFELVGLPDAAVRESRNRVRAAIKNSGYQFPLGRVTVNLSPAGLRKVGAGLDLPVALGILAAIGAFSKDTVTRIASFGELSLDGTVRAVVGILSKVEALGRASRWKAVYVPPANLMEAELSAGIRLQAATSLRDVVDGILAGCPASPGRKREPTLLAPASTGNVGDFADIWGQALAKRAMEIAAAGGHNVLLIGPPGVGKSMLASRMPGILPPLNRQEALEVTRIHSAVGVLQGGSPVTTRPFRAPHHTTTPVGLLGGGPEPRPGEITLAHRGVLFMDEFAEFRRDVIDGLRQPLEDGVVVLSRRSMSFRFPARVMLVAASNPCPCGQWGFADERCTCHAGARHRYRQRLYGPVTDRIDLQVRMSPPTAGEMHNGAVESSSDIRKRVVAARLRQRERWARQEALTNAEVPSGGLEAGCEVAASTVRLLRKLVETVGLSARGYHRLLRVSRTVADLDGCEGVEDRHVYEALHYRLENG